MTSLVMPVTKRSVVATNSTRANATATGLTSRRAEKIPKVKAESTRVAR
jgi:hypothetical protein